MTYEIGDKKNPQIILIHGLGGSAMIFFKLFKHFSEKYHVIAIDLLGMGRSSRPKFLARTKDEAEQYFCQSLEKWREAMGIDNMTIVAHSFGAHITSRYSLRYPDKVKKIIFWSPHGAEDKPNDYEEMLEKRMKVSCRFRCFMRMML
mmetsp:Transcript_18153/g.16060  ORF Transcript_18153/g.16060 Transcript_18153/m.16060 type:complete len:147 (+) Transcript_18153:358-798(+)